MGIKLKDLLYKSTLTNSNENGKDLLNVLDTFDYVYLPSINDINQIIKIRRDFLLSDYAILNGAIELKGDEKPKTIKENVPKSIFLRTPRNNSLINVFLPSRITTNQNIDAVFIYHTRSSVCPQLKLNANLFNMIKGLTIETEPYDDRNGIGHIVEFGEFPQTFVGKQMNNMLNNEFKNKKSTFIPTGKAYSQKEPPSFHMEFIHNSNKYIRINPDVIEMTGTFSDGTSIDEYDNYIWIKVEPIRWIITNWDKLPKNLNENGTGEDDFIELISETALISGLPFYINNFSSNSKSLWQNSKIRAYLNGYNIHNEISQNNGNPDFRADVNYDYTDISFLTQAFDGLDREFELKEIENKKGDKSMTTKHKFNISIDETPMSIDEQIKFYVDNRMQFMLHGKSGIGKSRRIQDIDPDFTSIVLRNGILPEEIIGKDTTAPDGKVTWKAPFWYEQLVSKCKADPDKTHVLFIDELTNVNEHEQSLVFDIILNNTIKPNLGKLPENCVVVSAGNSKDESNSAYNLTEPLFRRYFAHIYLPLDIPTWLEWGSQNRKKKVAIVDEGTTTPESIKDKYNLTGSADKYELVDDLDENGEPKKNIHPLVASFVGTYPKTFYSSYDADKEKEHSIDPRGWEQLSDVLYNNNGVIRKELLANKLGMQNAELFIAFAKQNFITLEDVVNGNYDISDIPTKFDAKYALALSLRYATEDELPIVRAFISEYLGAEILATYDFAWVNNNPEKAVVLEDIKNTTTVPKQVELPDSSVTTTNKLVKFTDFCGDHNPYWDTSRISKGNGFTYIVCNSKQETDCLCTLLDAYGKKTCDNKSYKDILELIHYISKGKPICYDNAGHYHNIDSLAEKQKTAGQVANIYQFSEVDFSGYLNEDAIKALEENIINKNQTTKEK